MTWMVALHRFAAMFFNLSHIPQHWLRRGVAHQRPVPSVFMKIYTPLRERIFPFAETLIWSLIDQVQFVHERLRLGTESFMNNLIIDWLISRPLFRGAPRLRVSETVRLSTTIGPVQLSPICRWAFSRAQKCRDFRPAADLFWMRNQPENLLISEHVSEQVSKAARTNKNCSQGLKKTRKFRREIQKKRALGNTSYTETWFQAPQAFNFRIKNQ